MSTLTNETARPTVVQINLSPALGGAEVYTASFSCALATRGWRTRVLVDASASFWGDLNFGNVEKTSVGDATQILAQVRDSDIALIHSPVPQQVLHALKKRAYIVGIAHQTVYDDRYPAYYVEADLLLCVSRHVIASLRRSGFDRVHGEPLYAVAETARRHHDQAIKRGSLCDWDMHKFRDRLFAVAARMHDAMSQPRAYTRRPGLTLGIVSRLAPLKQFPALFRVLAPVIARHAAVNVEVFGAAVGYKALRAIQTAMQPLGPRVRFWGHQCNVELTYRSIDYLLTGLPEREALGLNVIEACTLGTPVLAVDAPPFTETMREGRTGFLYADPRRDQGADFDRVLTGILSGELKPDLCKAAEHLQQFSFARFADRADAAVKAAVERMIVRANR